jgi:hypothetical protein
MTLKEFFGVLVMIGIIFLILNILFPNDNNATKSSARETSKPQSVMEGENGFLILPTFIAIDKESFDEYIAYSVADNTEAIKRMMLEGKLYPGKKGQRVTVIELGIMTSYIEIIDEGVRGYIETEYVKNKLEN